MPKFGNFMANKDNTTYLPRIIAGVISSFITLDEGIYSLLHNYSESLYIPAFN